MRVLWAFLICANPALAWEFADTPICTLDNLGTDPGVTLTYDGQIYTIRLDTPQGWSDAPVFSLRFVPNGPVISTTQHRIQGTVLEVTDTGFGNVLNGLQYNQTAQAILGDSTVEFDLTSAAGPVEAFRACDPLPLS